MGLLWRLVGMPKDLGRLVSEGIFGPGVFVEGVNQVLVRLWAWISDLVGM